MEAPDAAENEASSPSPNGCSTSSSFPLLPPLLLPHLPPHLRPPPPPLRAARLLDLPDDLLLLIMAPLDPLPDLFSLRRTCRRLAELGTAPELSLLVVAAGGGGGGGGGAGEGERQPPLLPFPRGHRARSCHETLASAVAAARPGDTVRVSPTRATGGERGRAERGDRFHELSQPVHVSSPLLIRGCGPGPEDTVLRESFSASEARKFPSEAAALRFSAAAVLENLTVVVAAPRGPLGCAAAAATAAAAVHHSKGALLVSKCCLVSYVGALPHLHAPLATSAVGREGGSGSGSGGEGRAARNVLRVEETRVSRRRSGGLGGGLGGGAAVRARGSGALASVRALPLPCGGVLLWCEVDADEGGGASAAAGGAGGLPRVGGGGGGGGDEGFVDALPTAAEVREAAVAAAAKAKAEAAAAKAQAAAAAVQAPAPPAFLLPLS